MADYIGISKPLAVVGVTPKPEINYFYGPWESINKALDTIPQLARIKGLTVGIIKDSIIVEYWFKDGVDLVRKSVDPESVYNKNETQQIINGLENTYVQKEIGKELIPSISLTKLNQLPTKESNDNTYVAKELGKSLIEDTKIAKLDALPSSVFSQAETQQAINMAISNLDDIYVAKEVGKELIPTTALNKLNQLPTSGNSLPFEVITDISEVTEEGVLYLLPYERPNSKYDEYLFVNGVPELMGSFDIDVDLSNYTTSSQLTTALSAYVTAAAFNVAISNLANTYVAKVPGKRLLTDTEATKILNSVVASDIDDKLAEYSETTELPTLESINEDSIYDLKAWDPVNKVMLKFPVVNLLNSSSNADVVASASYIRGTPNGMDSCTVDGNNVEILLTNAYVSRDVFPAAVDIVRVIYNGHDLVEGEDFEIETEEAAPRKKIILVNYSLHTDTDIIIVRYKTSIGVYGSIFQTSLERAENAAIGAENIADSKIDKTAIVDKLGTDPNKLMSQKATTDAIMKSYNYDVNLLAYGVRLDLTSDGKTLERVGNLSLHKTRPITSKAKNCVKNVAGVNYYLSNDTDLLKADGVTPSILDGTDGDVMKEIPELYVREYTEGNYAYTYISEFPLPNFIRIPKTYHGLYEGSYDTTTNQTRSVINATIRTGLPATGQSRSYYNNGARLNRNITWNIDTLLSNYVRELLFRVDYATYDSQAPYNSQPTAEGYLQGGLGVGVTTLDGRWEWNGYNPFIPCGYTSNLGNKTGVKDFTMPYGYDAQNATTHVNWYKGIYNTATIYNVGEYVSDKEDTTIGQGDGKLYKCIQQTTAGIPLTNTTYFTEQIRTKVQVNRFLVEMPFGHTFKHTIDSIIELTNAYTTTKCYIYDNPEHYPTSDANDVKTANARFLCNMPSAEGYVKTFNKYTLVPYALGGSSNSWCYDYYYWRGEAGGVLRGLLFGGLAFHSAAAGFGFSSAAYSPTHAFAYICVRLCCFEENIVINS